MEQIIEVVAALIRRDGKLLICRRPKNKARALLWEFVGGKVEKGESKEEALVRECREELAIGVSVGKVFCETLHSYPDITVRLTLFECGIAEGEPRKLEHEDIRWVRADELGEYEFCPADGEILNKLREIDAVLFDLDGTLLPMDQAKFARAYFARLAQKLAPYGYDPKELVDGILKGTEEMIRNDGSRTNEEVFWARFGELFGERVRRDLPVFEDFYRNEFAEAAEVCGFAPEAGELIAKLKGRVRLVLASNPIFPRIAQESRLRRAGTDPNDFEYITSYENSSYCKPNPKYYREIAEKLGLDPWRCVMVGNDAREDVAAEQTGMRVFLLTDCLLNPDGREISSIPHGGFAQLDRYLDELLGEERP